MSAQLEIPLGEQKPEEKAPEGVSETAKGVKIELPSDATDKAINGLEKPAEKPADRPEWLPEGFDTPEALAEAYKKLQAPKKEEAKAPEEVKIPTPEDIKGKGIDLDGLAEEFKANEGKLTDKTLADLEAKGIPKAAVQAYIDGQIARGQQVINEVAQHVGGPEQLQNILQWAATGLEQSDVEAYNALLATGDSKTMKVALDGLKAKMTLALGSDPSVSISGEGVPPTGGPKPFASRQEVVAAMSSPRYKVDPAYQQEVAKRLEVSNVF